MHRNIVNAFPFTRVLAPVADGTTVQRTSRIDMAGVEGGLFIVGISSAYAHNAANALVLSGTNDGGTNYDDYANDGTLLIPTGAASKILLVEYSNIYKHKEVTLKLVRTGSYGIDLVLHMARGEKFNYPVTQVAHAVGKFFGPAS